MKKNIGFIVVGIGFVGLVISVIYFISGMDGPISTKVGVTKDNLENFGIVPGGTGQAKSEKKDSGKIVVLMPGFFFNDGFIQLANQIKKEQGLTINYQTVEHFEDYKKMLKNRDVLYTGIDVFLVPTDWFMNFENSIKKVELGENGGLGPYFHPIFGFYVDNPLFTFIPYSIDPLVSFVSDQVNVPEGSLTSEKVLNFLTLYKTSKPIDMPLLWGIGKNDIRLLEQGGESFQDYFQILYNMIYEISQTKDQKSIETFLDINSFNSEFSRDYAEFKQLYKKVNKRSSNCDVYPALCVFVYKLTDIKFGFLSDMVIRNKYFTESTRKISETKILNFPNFSGVYRIRGWGFVVNKNSENDKTVKTFFQKYIKVGMANSLSLWDDTFSSFNNIYDIQKVQPKYENITKYETKFSIIYGGFETQKKFLENTKVLDLLKGKIDSEQFLSTLDWER